MPKQFLHSWFCCQQSTCMTYPCIFNQITSLFSFPERLNSSARITLYHPTVQRLITSVSVFKWIGLFVPYQDLSFNLHITWKRNRVLWCCYISWTSGLERHFPSASDAFLSWFQPLNWFQRYLAVLRKSNLVCFKLTLLMCFLAMCSAGISFFFFFSPGYSLGAC